MERHTVVGGEVYKHLAPLEPEDRVMFRPIGFRATVQSLAHVRGIAGLKNEVQYAAAGTEASGHAVGGVMIEVMLLHVAEIGIAKIAKMGRVMDPLFGDIGLESEGHHDRSGKGWKKQNA